MDGRSHYNPRIKEVEAGEPEVLGHPQLHDEFRTDQDTRQPNTITSSSDTSMRQHSSFFNQGVSTMEVQLKPVRVRWVSAAAGSYLG